MKSFPFHNTINLEGEKLEKANARAASQEDFVRALFTANPEKKFSPSQIQQIAARKYDRNVPLTSWRRACTNLTYEKHGKFLVKSQDHIIGPYGEREYLWELNREGCVDPELQDWFRRYQEGEFDETPKSKFIQTEMF